jgi:hypothetical protein
MAQRLLFNEPITLSDAEERELQTLAAETQRTPPLTPETAYLKARDTVGGEGFAQARAELSKLDKLDKAAERALNDYEEKLERGFKVGRILPNNAITLRRLHLEHQKIRESYNDAARRFETRLNALRTPEVRAQIRELAASMITTDQKRRQTVKEAAERIEIAYSRIGVAPALDRPKLELAQSQRPAVKPKM